MLGAVLSTLGAAWVTAAPGDVKASFPSPCKYPAGMATDGTDLFVVDWREAKIQHISTADGRVKRTLSAPTRRPSGLAFGDGRLFVADDHSGWIYVLNPKTGVVESSFEAPGARPTGLAYSDQALFILERKSGQIYKVMPADGTIQAYLPTPNETCTCLAYDGRYLWVSDRIKDEFYMVDPETGFVIAIVSAPGPHAAGLAWLDGYLWNVDFQTRLIYQIVVRDEQKYRVWDPREARVEYLWVLYNYGPGEVRDLTVSFAVPQSQPGEELLSELDYSQPATRIAADRWGQRCAIFELGALSSGGRQMLSYSVKARVSAIRYLILPEETGTLGDVPRELREQFTRDGTRYRIDSPFIQETVRKVVGAEQNPYWVARKIFNYLIDHLEYEMAGGWDVPEVALKRGKGSCSEYTFAFVALCRAAGLPARYRGSIVVRGDEASVDEAFHRWAEVYLPNYGWVPVDANKGDVKWPAEQARGFGELANRFLITTQGGGDSEYLSWGYNSFAKYQTTGDCKIEEETLGFWEPLSAAEKARAAGDVKAPSECRQP
jgi:transglutaminase-like putative cysteine protease